MFFPDIYIKIPRQQEFYEALKKSKNTEYLYLCKNFSSNIM